MYKEASYAKTMGIGAGLGGIGGLFTTDKNDTTSEKVKKVLTGAGLGAAASAYGKHTKKLGKERYASYANKGSAGSHGAGASSGAGSHGAGASSGAGSHGAGASSGAGSHGADKFSKAKDKFRSEFSGMNKADAKKKYREYANNFHPDRGGDEEMFKAVNSAYSTLFKK